MNSKPIANLRWYIAGFLCLASALNYLDRQTMSVLFDTISRELHLDNVNYGDINFWFLISYSVMYAVSGRVVDWIGTRRGFMTFVSGWSLANVLHVLARTVGQFSIFRFLLGVFEPGSFTGGVRAVNEWFPPKDRALAIGIFNSGTAVGSMIAAPVVSVIAYNFGWRAAFAVTGGLGFVWVAAWWFLYRSPQTHPRLSEAERKIILGDQQEQAAGERPARLAQLVRMPELWGCVLVRVLTDPISYLFLFWVPPYLQQRHGFDLKNMALFAWIPYAAATMGNLFGGAAPRFLIGRGWELDKARKLTMLVMTCLVPVFFVVAGQAANPVLALVVISCATFCHGSWGNITLVAEVFPKNAAGTVTGLAGAMGSMVSALSQLYIGRVTHAIGYTPIFLVAAGLYPLAMIVVFLLIRRLGVIRKLS